MEIGVGPGIRIFLDAENEPRCRGAIIEVALSYAESQLERAKDERRDFLLRWIELAKKQIEAEHFDARVDKEYKKEYARVEKHARMLPDFLRQPAEDFMRERIRKRLKPD